MICYYRNGKFMLQEEDARLKKGDKVVILTRSNRLKALRERFLSASMPGEKSAEGPDVRTED
jgi:NhaP-type Na+/H+ and K+/H+ antiporter